MPVLSADSQLHEQWTTVNGQRIFAHVSDQPTLGARSIVLVHGIGVSGHYLLPTAERLASHYFVAVPDLPGWGNSDKPDHSLTLAELADALADWMTAMGLQTATLLGNSFGCQIIVEFAMRHPDRLDRAVLVGPSGDPARRSPLGLLLRLGWSSFRERPSHVLRTMFIDYPRFGLKRGLETFQYMTSDPIVQKLPQMTAPTLVIRGGKDPIVSQEWVDRMTALLPHAESAVAPTAAHAVNNDEPDTLVAIVEPFLATPVGVQ